MNPTDMKQTPAAVSANLVADLARSLAVAKTEPKSTNRLDAAPFVVLRDDAGNERLEFVTKTLDKPHRKSGTVKLNDVDSFNAYYAIHGNGAPVFATLQPAKFVAVLNDHTKDAADWRDHRIDFTVAHSREWKEWTGRNGADKAFDSTESFALFLEENSPDIVKPDAATMLKIALNFRIKGNVAFQAVNRLQDGDVDLAYTNNVNATSPSGAGGSNIKIPEIFTIGIPVFDGLNAKKYQIDARFRFRLQDGGRLRIWYELIRPHKAIELAFKEIWTQIEKATKAPILHGTPE